MRLKFIGENGSMGLTHGKTYDVKVVSTDYYIWVEWGFCKVCPYDSPQSFSNNWERV